MKFAEVCLDKLNFQDDIDLMCLAIKLLFSSIQRWQSDAIVSQTNDEENKTDEREYLKEDCIRKLSEKLVSKLKGALLSDMPDHYRRDALSRELEVWIF